MGATWNTECADAAAGPRQEQRQVNTLWDQEDALQGELLGILQMLHALDDQIREPNVSREDLLRSVDSIRERLQDLVEDVDFSEPLPEP